MASSATEVSSAGVVSKRERHTKTDYSYVRRDLVGVAIVAAITLAFVIVMAILV